jgi:hypothetical protein
MRRHTGSAKKKKSEVNMRRFYLTTTALLVSTPAWATDGATASAFVLMGLAIILILLLYFLPWLIGLSRRVNSGGALLLVNLLLGWTLIGWLICMIWAVTGTTVEQDEFYRRAARDAATK